MRIFHKGDQTVSISTESIVKTIGLALLFMLAIRFLSNITHQLTLIGVAVFLALALNPAVSRLTRLLKSKSRVRATGVAYLIVLSVLTIFIALVVPPIVRQTGDFVRDLPQTVEDFQDQDSAAGRLVRRYKLDTQLEQWSDDLKDRSGDLVDPALETATRALGTVVSFITVLVLTFMMLVEGPLWFEKILSLQPADKRAERRKIAYRMYKVVTGYVNGQVFIAGIASAFCLIALLIGNAVFNASVNAVALAGISFVFALIPLIGNILGASIIVLMCLFFSAPFALAMGVYFIVYQQIENATLQPYVQSRGNQLTPLIIFISALLGAGFGGLLGALAAIPLAGCIRILLEEYLGKKLPSSQTVEDSNS